MSTGDKIVLAFGWLLGAYCAILVLIHILGSSKR